MIIHLAVILSEIFGWWQIVGDEPSEPPAARLVTTTTERHFLYVAEVFDAGPPLTAHAIGPSLAD